MLKIVYPICCGMDVHKSFVVACIASTNDHGVTTYKSRRFSTFTGDLHRCAAWLVENNCKDVCMESTGKYWIPIYNILEHTCNIVLAHPKYVKVIRAKRFPEVRNRYLALKKRRVTKKPSLPLQGCCWLPSTTFSRRMNPITPNCIGAATLRQNIEQFLWRRPSPSYKGKAISWRPAPLELYTLLVSLKSPFFEGLGFVRLFGEWYSNFNVSTLFQGFDPGRGFSPVL